MFLALASTMSVFNCRAVGAHAEKTFTRTKQVPGRTQRGTWKEDSWDLAVPSSAVATDPARGFTFQPLTGQLSFCLFPLLQVQTGDLKALLLPEVWFADGGSSHPCLSRVMKSAPQITFSSSLPPCRSHSQGCLRGLLDSARFSTAAAFLRQVAAFTQFPSSPIVTPSVLLLSSQSLFISRATSFSSTPAFSPPFSPWSKVICRMLQPRMLCCSAKLLVLLTTEVEWESAEEIESPPNPSQHSARLSPELSQWQSTVFMIG